LGLEGISKSQVSQLAKQLDKGVEEFRNRPLDKGPYPLVWLDAMTKAGTRRGPGSKCNCSGCHCS
jgi:transposase-like protein